MSGGARLELPPYLRNFPVGSSLDLSIDYENESLVARAQVRQVAHHFVTDQLGVALDAESIGASEIERFMRYGWRLTLTAIP